LICIISEVIYPEEIQKKMPQVEPECHGAPTLAPPATTSGDEGDEDDEGELCMLEMSAEDMTEAPKTRTQGKKQTAVVRQRWTIEEEKEIRLMFANFFKTGECPGQRDCEKAMRISKRNNGTIWNKKRDNIKKKVNNMILKEKRFRN
jgi:hypothetical protein